MTERPGNNTNGGEDGRLVRLAQQGDRRAIGELWLRHRRFVATVLLAHANSHELDDLLQDVALRVTKSIADLGDGRRLRAWLRTMARRVAIDHGRREKLRRNAAGGDGGLGASPGAELGKTCGAQAPGARSLQIVGGRDHDERDPWDPWVDGSAAASRREELEHVLASVAKLPRPFREPLLLRALDGMSQRQIAAALELPETTVETRIARARRLLRDAMAEADHLTDSTAGSPVVAPTAARESKHASIRRTLD
ncbi:MAG: RNA polymerase sigma factor [Planctomycetota bacterium]